MGRPSKGGRPYKEPNCEPTAAFRLGEAMRAARTASRTTATQAANAYGCKPAFISSVELGRAAAPEALVDMYEREFHADGVLREMFKAFQATRRAADRAQKGRAPLAGSAPIERRNAQSEPGDASEWVSQSIAHGAVMEPGAPFEQRWVLVNSGTVDWVGRALQRVEPISGPASIISPHRVAIPSTRAGTRLEIAIEMKAPIIETTSVVHYKMVNAAGELSFPDKYSAGLDTTVTVRRSLRA